MAALDRAINHAGGLSALAKKIGLTPQAVCNWRHRGVPPERCVDIEMVTNQKVTRRHLRPDIFGPAPALKKAA